MREKEPMDPTLMTLPSPKPVVAPAFLFRTRVHLSLNSFSRRTSIPMSCKTRKTSSMTSLGGLEERADWSTKPLCTRNLASSARVEDDDRVGAFCWPNVAVAGMGAVAGARLCDIDRAAIGFDVAEAAPGGSARRSVGALGGSVLTGAAAAGGGDSAETGGNSLAATRGVLSAVRANELVDDMAALTTWGAPLRVGSSETRTNDEVESDRICDVLMLASVSLARLLRRNQSMTFLAGPLETCLFSLAAAVCASTVTTDGDDCPCG